MTSRTRTTLLIAIAGVIALAAVVYVVWQHRAGDELNSPSPEIVQRPTVSPQPGPRTGGSQSPPANDSSTKSHEASSGNTQQKLATDAAFESRRIPHDVPFQQVKADLWEDVQANPPELLKRDDPLVDADLAYRIYMFYGNCSATPRTSQAIDTQLDQMADHAERTASRGNSGHLEGIENSIDRMMNVYEMCLAIPADVDPRLEAVQWMTAAVELGHEIAQVQFYEKAMGFMVRPDHFGEHPPVVMNNPGLIEAFKSTARYGLSQGLEKGHPEAYVAMARVLMEGLLYARDPVMAYAYARAAELKAGDTQAILVLSDHHKQRIAQHLTRDQIAEAERLALELWKESRE